VTTVLLTIKCEMIEKIASNPGGCEAAGWRFNSRRAGESRTMACLVSILPSASFDALGII